MDETSRSDCVALSATPPLLADCLRVLLEPVVHVIVVDRPPACRHAVALCTPGAPDIDADVVIRLDPVAVEDRDCVAVASVEGGGVHRLRDLDDVLDYVQGRLEGDRD